MERQTEEKINPETLLCIVCDTVKPFEDFYKTDRRRCKRCVIKRVNHARRVKEPQMTFKKSRRVLHMIVYLMRGRRTKYEVQKQFKFTNINTAVKYLALIDKMDLGLEQDFENKYFIVEE